ncbi:short-chain dehydrogenase/reductase SDR [Ignisphaera aggregans DSM 17230]|uniref:Short-chain dehydrogenase/reductase SDR n=1 Tax=Ignisphaera aggregans (strain DSM 17230 / JCM 13409 / AQ1.S1) TaxID=583356 RepID=E0SNU9_IGNAA|nr:short-chain dehydrogenase/reductase SDR [Ignisphaera aggregans DSM 17230]
MYERFRDKTCIVTGGARGIGAAIAYRLASEGCRTAILDIDEYAGRVREAEFVSMGLKTIFIKADVSIEEEVSRAIDKVYKTFGSIDVLINNAGIGFSGKPIELQSIDEWRRIIDVNLTGPYLCSKHVVRYMKSRGGVIINIASTRALQSEPHTEPYSASKGGLLALTHALAISLAPYKIRVLAVSPGWIDTSLWQIPRKEPKLSPLDHRQHPAGRVGRPEDIAALVAFLASDEAEWITGVNIVIDGGMTIKMIYIDENVIEDSIATLIGDRDLASMIRILIESAKEDKEKVKEILRKALGNR